MSNLAAIIPSKQANFVLKEVDIYKPGPKELFVKNEVIGFNLIESKIANLGALPIEYPAILGSSFAGTIEAVGSAVTKWKIGDRVVASKRVGVVGNQYGAYQRYVVTNDEMISKLPDGVDMAVAASLIMNLTCVPGLLSGRLGLSRPPLEGHAQAQSKDVKILVYGGSSSYGGLAVQYLSQAGYNVITTSSPKNHYFVDRLGARAVIDHTRGADQVVEDIRKHGPIDFVVDSISLPETIAITSQILATQGGGKLYAMQPAFGPELLPAGVERVFEPWSEPLYEENNKDLRDWVMEQYFPKGLVNGRIIALPVEKVGGGLAGVSKALDRMLAGTSGIRLVADPWEGEQ